jgi:hypothetical protein
MDHINFHGRGHNSRNPRDLARNIVCDAAVAVLRATGANPSSLKVQAAMNRATDRAITQITEHDSDTRRRAIEEVREAWAARQSAAQLELDV